MAKRGTPHREYELLEQVGTGSFGTVHRAVNKSSHEIVAIKIMKKTSKGDCTNAREYRTLKNLAQHPNIVKLHDSYTGPTKELYFIMEYMNGGNLYQLIKQRREAEQPLEHSKVRSILRQTLTALAHLHQQGIFHRDMKPENLLIGYNSNSNKQTMKLHDNQQISSDSGNEDDDGMIIKLADFGLAREIKSKPPYTEYVSTRWYRAPEVLLHATQYSDPVDLWAIGAIFAELVSLKPIFPGRSEIDQLYRICQILGSPSGTLIKKQRRLTPLLKKSSTSTPSPNHQQQRSSYPSTTVTSQHPPSLPPLNHHQQQHDIVHPLPPISPPPDLTRDWSDGIRLAHKLGFEFPQFSPKPLSTVLPTATQPMLDLLQQFLMFDPTKRISASDALNSSFLGHRHPTIDHIKRRNTFNFTSTATSTTPITSIITSNTATSSPPDITISTTPLIPSTPSIILKQPNKNSNHNENMTPSRPIPQPQRKSLLWAKGVSLGTPKSAPSPSQQQELFISNNTPKPTTSNMAQDIRGVLRLSKSKTIDRLQRTKKPSFTSLRIAAANIGRSASSYDFGGIQQEARRRSSSEQAPEELRRQEFITSSATSTTDFVKKKNKSLSTPPSQVLQQQQEQERSNTNYINKKTIKTTSEHSVRRNTSSSSISSRKKHESHHCHHPEQQQQEAFDLPSIPLLSPIQMCSDWGSTTRVASLVQQRMV